MKSKYIFRQKAGIFRLAITACITLNLLLCGCITEYQATGIEEISDIFVVEGFITDGESYITQSRSVTLTDDPENPNPYASSYVEDATVYVECDDGTQAVGQYMGEGKYLIVTGELNMERKYRLRILASGEEYGTGYSAPMQTPEIEEISWIKAGRGEPVYICVNTNDPAGQVEHYRWSYKETWEINSEYELEGYPYYCWRSNASKSLFIGSTEKLSGARILERLYSINPSDRRLSVLYHVEITQNAISKEAYDYFSNIKKNVDLTGDIFSPTPSELRGNISCITDPNQPVIGYVDVSTTVRKNRFISRMEGLYEHTPSCTLYTPEKIEEMFPDGNIPAELIYLEYLEKYTYVRCVDCTYYGTTQKPDFWP